MRAVDQDEGGAGAIRLDDCVLTRRRDPGVIAGLRQDLSKLLHRRRIAGENDYAL
jgi:hypothetical protein